MNICIVGGELSGKSTLFNLLTGLTSKTHPASKGTTVGVAKLPDERVDYLSGVYNPRKTIYAQIDLTDVSGSILGKSAAKAETLSQIRLADAALVVARAFENDAVPWPDEGKTPDQTLRELVEDELIQDMDAVGKAIEKAKSPKGKLKEWQITVLERVNEWLDKEKPLWSIESMELSDDEEVFLRGYAFLTSRPHLCAVNIGEQNLISGNYEGRQLLEQFCANKGLPVIEFSGAVELEISGLPADEQKDFLKEYGLKQSGIYRIARTLYDHLGLISFFTVGEDEVKSWTISKGTHAQAAAGKIHSDIQRGFIRAEVASFGDFRQYGSMKALKQNGLLRLEAKDYVVKDGDIITFRFNV